MEAIILAVLLLTSALFVTTFSAPTHDTVASRASLEVMGEDVLTLLHGMDGCAAIEADARRERCERAHGEHGITRLIAEALAGTPENLTQRMDTVLPVDVNWNLYLESPFGVMDVVRNGRPDGERVTAELGFAPEYDLTAVVPRFSTLAYSDTGENNLVVQALPLWHSGAVALDAGDTRTVTFPNDHAMDLTHVRVDAKRDAASTLASWPFDEGSGTTARDDAGVHDQTVDAARWTNGRVGNALVFDESGHAFDATITGASTRTATVQAWVHPTVVPNRDAAVISVTTASDALELWLTAGDGAARGIARSGGTSVPVTGPVVPLNAWTHLAVTLGEERVVLYVNGVPVDTKNAPGPLDETVAPVVAVGDANSDDTDPAGGFRGRLDRPRVYDRELHENEFSLMRFVHVPPERSGAPGWDPTTGTLHAVESDVTYRDDVLTGRGPYRVIPQADLASHAPDLNAGVDASRLAAYATPSKARHAVHGEVVRLEADFTPLVDRVNAASGLTLVNAPDVTVRVRGPVTQPFESVTGFTELRNVTLTGVADADAFTVPDNWLLGTHVVEALVPLELELSDGTRVDVVARKADYLHVVHDGASAPPVNPPTRAVLELWYPEWA